MIAWLVIAALVVLARPALAVYRLARVGPAGARYWLPMQWAAWRFRWLTRNAGLSYIDRCHRRKLRPRLPFTTAVRVQDDPVTLHRWPRARFRVTEYGWQATVRTIPRVGREEFAAAVPWIADAWAAHRVSAHQSRPGRVELRAFRADPLAVPYGPQACPAGTFTATRFPGRLLLGRDDAAAWRGLPLANTTGATVTGQPGSGKSTLLHSWLMQLAGVPCVDLLILNGKGDSEYDFWQGRATVLGDDLDAAEDALVAEGREMRHRHATVRERTGYTNAWRAGPSEQLPMRVIVLDECDRFLHAQQYARNSPKDEAHARVMAQTVSTLIRRGRSVLEFVILATQQGLAEAFGNSMVRNNCALSLAFSLRTRDAARGALGDAITDFPDLCPSMLQGPEMVGVCTASMKSGLDPFTLIRCPEITEAAAAARAGLTVRRAPAAAPAAVPELERVP